MNYIPQVLNKTRTFLNYCTGDKLILLPEKSSSVFLIRYISEAELLLYYIGLIQKYASYLLLLHLTVFVKYASYLLLLHLTVFVM